MYRLTLVVLLLPVISSSLGCTGPQAAKNSNSAAAPSTQNANWNANGESNSGGGQPSGIEIKEPERYGVAITISAQDIAGAPAPMATQQFGFAKLGADRRWAFNFPTPLGQVVYLEKSGLKYLVLFDHKQYTELTPDTLSFSMTALSPGAIAEHLKPRMQFEKLDQEPLNGRTVMKYRLAGARDDSESDGAIFVDSETGLPLRSDFFTSPQAGTRTRVIVEARDVQLNPDRSQFDVPAGMKKITTQEAKQQIGEFASRLRGFADIVSGARPASAALADQPATSLNRRVRRGK